MTQLHILSSALSDRGSKYAVSGASARDKSEIETCLKLLKSKKKFAKATHHSWACLSTTNGLLKQDDGEAGAGMVIARMLEREDRRDHLVIVTRWFGGTKLVGDRFRRIQDCVRLYLDDIS